MKTVMLVFGTRPEAIKMAPLVKTFQKYPNDFRTVVCVTGQHRQMLDQVLELFHITPDYDLDIMRQGQDLYDITSRILLAMRDILKTDPPHLVMVHGDTSTSVAAALAAFYSQIPVAHVEAGLRTFDIYSPWPEEMNRQMTGRLATYHFAPTQMSSDNLLAEGIAKEKICITGNTVIDALYQITARLTTDKELRQSTEDFLRKAGYNPERLTDNRKLVLITGHRRENFGEKFLEICEAIKELSQNFPEVDFIYPMHLNPNVRKPIEKVFGKDTEIGNLFFIEPLEYLPFVYLMERSTLILTDSGGVQEEAPGLGKPVLVMRDTTERPEAVEAGTVKLVGTNRKTIVEEVVRLLFDKVHYNKMSKAINPYGDGNACKRILDYLQNKPSFQE